MITLQTPLRSIVGIGAVMAKRLESVGLNTVGDLLEYFPFRHEDYTFVTSIPKVRIGEETTIKASIKSITNQRTSRKHILITRAGLIDEAGEIDAIWFNQPFLIRTLTIGSEWIFHGRVDFDRPAGKVFVSPNYERRAGILPVYHETQGLTSKWLRRIVDSLLHLASMIEDYLPENVRVSEDLLSLPQAISAIHFPKKRSELEAAKTRLGFDELFLIALRLLSVRRQLDRNRAPAMTADQQVLKQFAKSLPFELTAAQKQVNQEIVEDLVHSKPMNRLLEGEVGSGKTVVAAMAALLVAKSGLPPARAGGAQAGYQTAWLAPTEILANQHFRTISQLLKPFKISVALMTATTKLGTQADVVIGTHALLQEHITFKKLGLIIVDEQHRFGVKQRALLKGAQAEIPHFLSMTATPIPRTLALAIYGDLDLSVIDELPVGRKKIITKVVDPENRDKAYQFIRDQVRQGRQVYVITPLIELPQNNHKSSQKPQKSLFEEIERKSAVAEYEKLRTRVFPELRIGLLHGRMKGKDKDKIMTKFKNRQLDILVSTAVIEVGIDVPNATVMMIEDADRFGLAQLHQFRGRVGRGEHQSYCFLFSSVGEAISRLKAMEQYDNGFKLAEVDLKMRGPGELVGARQSGLPDLKMASLGDTVLIQKARSVAQKVIAEGLEKYPKIAEKLSEFERIHHLE